MTHKALHPRDDEDLLHMSRTEGGSELINIEDGVDVSIQLPQDYIKVQRKTDYSNQKQYRQHKNQLNKNNQTTKNGKKTTAWAFQATNKQNLTRENVDMAKKGKPYERN